MRHTCEKCGSALRMTPIENYEPNKKLYAGIRVMLVNNAVQAAACDTCGTKKVEIPDPAGLTAAVAVTRATHRVKLGGSEIKFMRKAMEMPAKEVAKLLDVSEETISRWENDHQPIGGANEKMFRYLACKVLADAAPAIQWGIDAIMELEIAARINGEEVCLAFERTKFKAKPAQPTKPVWAEELQAAA